MSGVHIYVYMQFGQNALHWASNKGHGHVVEWLIDEMGMNPNEHDSDVCWYNRE